MPELSEAQRKALVNRIVQEVLFRIKQQEPENEVVRGTVVLVTSHIPSPGNALQLLKEKYAGELRFVNFTNKRVFPNEVVINANDVGEDEVMELVSGAASVVLLSPKIGVLEEVANGADQNFVSYLMVRALLWGRNVGVVLDFKPPRFRRNTFYERLADVIQTLEETGAKILTYRCAEEAEATLLTLVTEDDVLQAHRNNQKQVYSAAGAIVTALAADKAKELGIRIN